jgi:hypothetical protein
MSGDHQMSLETFAPTPRIVVLNDGRQVSVLPLRLGQMPAFTAAAKAAAPSLFVADYMTILEQHPADAMTMIAVATALSPAETEALWQDETVALLSTIYEVNSDFFIQRLRPAMTKAAGDASARIKMMTDLLGAMSLPGSDSLATTSPPA